MWYTGTPDKDYTGDAVSELMAGGETKPGWGNIHKGSFTIPCESTAAAGYGVANGVLVDAYGHPVLADFKKVDTTNTIFAIAGDEVGTFGSCTRTFTVDAAGAVTVADGAMAIVAGDKLFYRYDNITVPQAELPTLRAEMANIPLYAKARRIAVFYSQIAAFQA